MNTKLSFSFAKIDLNIGLDRLLIFIVLWVLASFVDILNPYKVPILVLTGVAFFVRILLLELTLQQTYESGHTETISVKGPNIALLIAALIMIFRYPIPFSSMTYKIIEAVVICLIFAIISLYKLFKVSAWIDWFNSINN